MSNGHKQPTEFDSYAVDYATLLHDPIREKFGRSEAFFFERKIQVIQGFFRKSGLNSRQQSWLDVGCGQGGLLRAGRPLFKTVAGCDPSEGMLKSCSGIEVRHQASADRLPFEDSSFDFITAVCVYHHVPLERRLSLTLEIERLLKPRGVVCIIEHNPLNPVTRVIVARSPIDADAHLLGLSSTKELLAAARTRIVDWQYFLLFPQAVYKSLAAIEHGLASIPLGGQYAVFAQKQ